VASPRHSQRRELSLYAVIKVVRPPLMQVSLPGEGPLVVYQAVRSCDNLAQGLISIRRSEGLFNK
jgi:hypothetical protein